MSKQINIVAYCDNKARHGQQQVEAAAEHTITVDGQTRIVDFCAGCVESTFQSLVSLMANGAPPDDTVQPKRGSGRRPENLPTLCPIDGKVSKSRAGLGQHLKTEHGQKFADFPGMLKSPSDYVGLAHQPA